jgi:hypothetical protein
VDETPAVFRPPHMAFATLWNFLADLASRPLPPQIDRMMLSNKSGTDQNNLLHALGVFRLIGEQQRVLPKLEALAVPDEEQRKVELRKLVEEYYPDAVALSKINGTHQQLQDIFKEKFGLDSTDTRRKSITFFLHAARIAELPISAYFPATRSGSGGPGAPRPKRSRSAKKSAPPTSASQQPAGGPPDEVAASGGSVFSTEVRIKAGRVKLTVDVNPIELRGDERTFFYLLIDKMEEFAAAHPISPAENGEAPDNGDEGGSP